MRFACANRASEGSKPRIPGRPTIRKLKRLVLYRGEVALRCKCGLLHCGLLSLRRKCARFQGLPYNSGSRKWRRRQISVARFRSAERRSH